MTIRKIILSCLLLAGLPTAVLAADIQAQIQAQNDAYGAAYKAGDAAAVAALHTEDTTLIPPNHPLVRGREGVQAFIAAELAMGDGEIVLTAQEVSQHGDTAYELGSYTLKLMPPYGAPIEDSGHYLVVWQKGADGIWRLHWDAFNSELPLSQ